MKKDKIKSVLIVLTIISIYLLMDNAFTRILKEVVVKLNKIDERQKEVLFSTEDFEKVEKEDRKINWIIENH